jgi:hypothetical protein
LLAPLPEGQVRPATLGAIDASALDAGPGKKIAATHRDLLCRNIIL